LESPAYLLSESPLYTLGWAAKFAGARPADVSRWVAGYRIRDKAWAPVTAPAVRDPDDGQLYLTFHHLIEVWTVQRMRQPSNSSDRLSLQKIRQAANAAQQHFNVAYPLADERLRWDGAGIFYATLGDEAVAGGLLELSKRSGQLAWSSLVEEGLKRIDYLEQRAIRLWPLGRDRRIVLDPQFRFGWPTVAKDHKSTGIPADTVAEMVAAGESERDAASAYQIEVAAVTDAVDYFKGLRVIAA
jgi:uncharacterized protein (DUF433 family)